MLSETCTPCSAVIPSLEAWVLLLSYLFSYHWNCSDRNYAYSDGWQHNLLGFSCISPTSLFSNPIPVSRELKAGCQRERNTKWLLTPLQSSPPALSPPQHCIQQLLRFCCWAFLCSSVYLFLNGRKILLLINLHSEWFEVFIKVTGKKQFPNLFHVPTVDKSGLLVPRDLETSPCIKKKKALLILSWGDPEAHY